MADNESQLEPKPLSTLRERAEQLLRAKPTDMSQMRTEDVRALVHELNVYQIELEIQNEELRNSQVELAHTRDRYADLYEFAPVAYLTLDRRSFIRSVNLTGATILQANRVDLIGKPLTRFMAADQADLLHNHLERVFARDERELCELQLAPINGDAIHVRLESISAMGQESQAECRTIMSDITELTLAKQAAERSQQLATLGTIAAGIAHEINNPLWMISLQADVALASKKKSNHEQTVTECLQEIKHLVCRGGRIVDSVRRLSNSSSTERNMQSIVGLIDSACEHTRTRADEKQVCLVTDLAENLPEVMISATEIEQVFTNLLDNAIDASEPGGVVRVIALVSAKNIAVSVQDEGCGISSDKLKRIYEPFYTTRRNQGGTGLGLSITHKIIEDHQGTIDVASQVGQGTTVTISVPVADNVTP